MKQDNWEQTRTKEEPRQECEECKDWLTSDESVIYEGSSQEDKSKASAALRLWRDFMDHCYSQRETHMKITQFLSLEKVRPHRAHDVWHYHLSH